MIGRELISCMVFLSLALHSTFVADGFNVSRREVYDINVRPNDGGEAVNVTTRVYVRNLKSIDERKFTYEIDYLIYHWYRDPRLSRGRMSAADVKKLNYVDDIWSPHLGLINCFNKKAVTNSEMVVVSENGDIFLNKRFTATCYCIMDLTTFPMDTQHCTFRLESYRYSTKDIRLIWDKKPVVWEEGLKIVGYFYLEPLIKTVSMVYGSGTWEVLEVMFSFKRMVLHFVYRVYIPIIFLMIFNMASYWIPPSAVPARVGLIITTFLTSQFVLQSVSTHTAKSSQTSSLQIFLVFSILLVATSMIVFIVVLVLMNREQNQKATKSLHTSLVRSTSVGISPNDQFQQVVTTTTQNKWTITSRNVDRVARVFFPVLYMTFCAVYFGYFLNKESERP